MNLTALLIVLWLAGLGWLSYHRASLRAAIGLSLAIPLAGFFSNAFSPWVLVCSAAICAALGMTHWRYQWFSRPALKTFRKVMPEMSQTEQEAIDAGTTWWDKDLFSGAPDWQRLHNYPAPRLSAEEQAFYDGPVQEVCAMINDHDVCHERADLPPEVWQYLKDNKFFAMIIKKKYGGLDFSAYAQSMILQRLAGVNGVLSSTVGVPNSLGPGELLQHYGTEEQKDYYLPRLAVGDEIPCFALTSPEAGSDAGSIPDFGIVCKGMWQGEEVLGMKLTWNKRYITLAPIATVLGLAFKLRDPDGLLGDKPDIGMTCALVPTNTPGVDIGRRHFPLSLPFQNGPTRGDGVFVPLDYIIGGPKMAGQGWRMLVECLSVGRGITLPSTAAGTAKMIALATGAYARIRRQFKTPLGQMEGIQEPLARLGGHSYMMGAACQLTTTGLDLGEKPSVISAIVKYHLTQLQQQSFTDAMDIHAGKGVCMGPKNYVGRGYQAAPISITVEGANILTRSMVIYGQGAIRCHPYVLAELDAARCDEPHRALEKFDRAVMNHIGFAFSNAVRSFWYGLTGARLGSAPYADSTKRYYQQMARISANLALLSDVSMAVLGGSLKRRERTSARLGDMLSQLYLCSATLKRFNDEGRQEADRQLVDWAAQDAINKAQVAMLDLLDNYPVRWVGRMMKMLIMPFGRFAKAPSDKLDRQLSEFLMTPSAARDRLGDTVFMQATEYNHVGTLQNSLKLIIKAEALVDKVSKATSTRLPMMKLDQIAEQGLAQGVLNEDEAQLLRDAEVARMQAITVDDFAPHELAANRDLVLAQAETQDSEEQAA